MDKTLEEVKELILLACKKLREDSTKKHSKLIWLLEDSINLFYEEEEITSKDELFLSDTLVNLIEDDEERASNS